jgi:hypothetical protein
MRKFFSKLFLGLLLLASVPAFSATYYVSSAGNDSNSGTATTTPWLHAPGMVGFTGTYTCNTGDFFIFRGGDTWHFGNSSASPYVGGVWALPCSGVSGNPQYIGSWVTWFSGSSWVRPVFTRDNALNSGFPSSCTYDNAAGFINASSVTNVTVDNIEFTGVCWSSSASSNFFMVQVNGAAGANITVSNTYTHGWSMVAGGYDGIYGAGAGGATAGLANGNSYVNNVVYGSDSTAGAAGNSGCQYAGYASSQCYTGGGTYTGFQTISRSIFTHLSNANVANAITMFNDNVCSNLYVTATAGGQHTNCLNVDATIPGTNFYFFGNTMYESNGSESLYLPCPSGEACYIYNNVWYENGAAIVEINPHACINMNVGPTGSATAYFYDNTFEYGDGSATGAGACQIVGQNANLSGYSDAWNGTMYFENNHFINFNLVHSSPSISNAVTYCNTGGGATCTFTDNGTELFQTEAAANAQGYTPSNGYAPTAGGSTIGAGTNLGSLASTFNADTFGSFLYGTSGGASEVSGFGGQTAVYPAVYQNPRPVAWDIGAYQYVAVNAYALNVDNLYCPTVGCTPTWGATDGPATLPTVAMNTALANTPSPGGTVVVTNPSQLTSAFASPVCGTTIQIQDGVTYSGTFTLALPSGTCSQSNWLTITTSGYSSLPAEGTRISPCYAGITSLQGRPPYGCPATPGNYMAQIVTPNSSPAITFTAGTSYVRLMGLEITRTAGTGYVSLLVKVGQVGNISNIIFDRDLFHGDEMQDETETALSFNAVSNIAVIDSYAYNFYCVSVCSDSHVFFGGTNTTNSTTESGIKVVNNFIEASGENILFGGGVSNTTPSNIEVRLNNKFKPRQWNQSDPSYDGGLAGTPPVVKNAGELKNAQLMLYEGNQVQNVWAEAQAGYAYLLNASPQGTDCPACFVTNITHRYETINNACAFMEITAVGSSPGGEAAAAAGNWSIHDILADDLFNPALFGCQTSSAIVIMSENDSPTFAQALKYVSVNHVSIIQAATSPTPVTLIGLRGAPVSSGNQMEYITFTNNLGWTGTRGTSNQNGTGCAYGITGPTLQLPNCWSPYTFGGNCFINNGSITWPGTNVTSVASFSAVFTNYNNGNAGNYLLANSEACKGAATDLTDPGANLTILASVLAGNPAPVTSLLGPFLNGGPKIKGGVLFK